MQHGLEQGVARGAREKTREASRRVIVMGVSIAQSPQVCLPIMTLMIALMNCQCALKILRGTRRVILRDHEDLSRNLGPPPALRMPP